MKLSECAAPFERLPVHTYKKDGNTPIIKHLDLQQLEGTLYRGRAPAPEYGRSYCPICLFFTDIGYGIQIGTVSDDYTLEEVKQSYPNIAGSIAEFITEIERRAADQLFIREIEIALINQIWPEREPFYRACRQAYKERQDARRAQEKAAKAARDAKEKAELDAETERKLTEAKRIIRDGGKLENETISFYVNHYRSEGRSIVLHLMRMYDINVPLKVQGWINNKLANVSISDSGCAGYQYMRNGRAKGSQAFYGYMAALIDAILFESIPTGIIRMEDLLAEAE